MSQIQYYKKIIHDNIVNYVLRNASDKSEEDQKNLIESYEKSADSFLDRLKNYTQYHLDDYNFPLGLSKKDKEEKKKYLKDIIFRADYNTPSQIVLFGKKHNDYYQVNINDFQNEIKIKVRSTGKLLRAKVKFNSNKAEVDILDGESGISPGQACVFYLMDETGDKVLGGGWIDKTFNKNLST